MKKLLFAQIIFAFALFFHSCGNVIPTEAAVEDDAKLLLAQANEAYSAKEYNKARMLMDSIRRAYPKAFKTLCEVEELYHKVLVDEKVRDVAFYENELAELVALRDSVVRGFDRRKDPKYDDKAVYSVPSQAISKNSNNCFMRATVDESGDAVITSFYRGNRIGYDRIKLSSGGLFVEASVDSAVRSWTGKEYGVYVERHGFRLGNDGGMMQFIASADGKVVVELIGDGKSYSYELRKEDVSAVTQVLELQRLLASIIETRSMLDSALYALSYLNHDVQESQPDSVI